MRQLAFCALTLLTFASLSACGDGSDGAASSASSASTTTMAALVPGDVLPPNEPRTWELAVHCGAGFLSYKINGKWWRAAEAAGNVRDWMPAEWPAANGTTGMTVVLEVNTAGDQLKVTYADRTVAYSPTELGEADLCA